MVGDTRKEGNHRLAGIDWDSLDPNVDPRIQGPDRSPVVLQSKCSSAGSNFGKAHDEHFHAANGTVTRSGEGSRSLTSSDVIGCRTPSSSIAASAFAVQDHVNSRYGLECDNASGPIAIDAGSECTVPSKSSRSTKARRAMPQGHSHARQGSQIDDFGASCVRHCGRTPGLWKRCQSMRGLTDGALEGRSLRTGCICLWHRVAGISVKWAPCPAARVNFRETLHMARMGGD